VAEPVVPNLDDKPSVKIGFFKIGEAEFFAINGDGAGEEFRVDGY
jgi:hypothetical protein